MGKRYKTSETTCQAISGALKQLMTQKPLERITVAEIMDTCGMRRQHFYYYFTDIYDLLRWTFEKEALELLQQQQGVSPWQNGFLHLFQYINQNRAVWCYANGCLHIACQALVIVNNLHTTSTKNVASWTGPSGRRRWKMACQPIRRRWKW